MEENSLKDEIYNCVQRLPFVFSKDEELLCINLARNAVQAVVLVREDWGVDFCQSYDVSVSDDLESTTGEALAVKHCLALLKQDLQTAGYGESLQCVVALEGNCYREEMEMPLLPKEELQEALAWEVPEHIPWEKESYSYGFRTKVVADEEENAGGVQKVEVFALQKPIIDEVLESIVKEGWNCVALTVAEALEEQGQENSDFAKVNFYEGFYRPEQLLHLKESYRVCIQLGLDYYLKKIAVDFLPTKQKQSAWLSSKAGILTLISKLVLLISMLLIVGANAGKYYASYELNQKQERLEQLSQWEQRIKDWHSLNKEKQELEKEITALGCQKLYWSKYLQNLADVLPQGVWLTKLQQGKQSQGRDYILTISGKAQNSEQLTGLMEALKRIKTFTEVELTNSQEGKNVGELLEFSLQAKISKGARRDAKQD